MRGPWGTVNLHVSAKGELSLITGKGVGVHVDFASEARFTLTGSISGSSVTLEGMVIQVPLRFPFLLGTPILIYADASTGDIYFSFGPIAGGPITMVFEGTGTVVINN